MQRVAKHAALRVAVAALLLLTLGGQWADASVINPPGGASGDNRFVFDDTGTSGGIHWHIEYDPITEEGFVVGL